MKEFLKEHGVKLNGEVVEIGRRYFLVNETLKKYLNNASRKPEFIGTYLGVRKKSFYPSPELIDIASKQSSKKAIINEKAEWMFLCGKDVFAENVEGKKDGTVFVMNEKDENLGLGYWTKKKGKKIIKNVIDKGKYLRD